MAVCPGNTVELSSSPSENLQNKEVCSLYMFLWEDVIDINSANNDRTLIKLSRINKS